MSDNQENMLPDATENQSTENEINSVNESLEENTLEQIESSENTNEIFPKEDVLVENDSETDNQNIENEINNNPKTDTHNVFSKMEENMAEQSEEYTVFNELPIVSYDNLLDENAIIEALKDLIDNHPVQIIGKHVEELKRNFNVKFGITLKEAKEKFLENGGDITEFHFESTFQKEYNDVLFKYKKLRQEHQNEIEQIHKNNLSLKLALIEELKDLIENGTSDSVFKKFKEIQSRWREIGPVPRENYADLWRTYHFHIERFYDLLHLSNELRDLDFKHNYEEKIKLVNRVEELAESEDIKAAFDELQIIHRLWKEEIGPVSREHRDEIWNRFSEATKKIHDRRHLYFEVTKGEFEENLKKKEAILEKLKNINEQPKNSHSDWQKSLTSIEKLRKEFIDSGHVAKNKDKEIWEKFRELNKIFNVAKNEYYIGIKKIQHENLNKKMALVQKAEDLRENEDWENTTEIMKNIQNEWKNIGHVPKQYSDKLWNRFKEACNFYFNRLHKMQDENEESQMNIYIKKKNYLEILKEESEKEGFNPDIEQLKKYIAEWKELGTVPPKQRYIEAKFNKFLDPYFENLSADKTQSMMMRYKNMIDTYLEQKDVAKLNDEIQFVRKRIETVSKEKQQMETNRMFFSNADNNNPMIRKIMNEIEKLSLELNVWESKLQYLRSIDF